MGRGGDGSLAKGVAWGGFWAWQRRAQGRNGDVEGRRVGPWSVGGCGLGGGCEAGGGDKGGSGKGGSLEGKGWGVGLGASGG